MSELRLAAGLERRKEDFELIAGQAEMREGPRHGEPPNGPG